MTRDAEMAQKKEPRQCRGSKESQGEGIDQKLNWVRSAYWPVSSPFTSFSPFV